LTATRSSICNYGNHRQLRCFYSV